MLFKLFYLLKAPKEFDKLLLASVNSSCYKEFCLKVYGEDFSQFNIVDEESFSFFLKTLEKIKVRSALDLGCGNGVLTTYLAQKLDCHITGVDFSPQITVFNQNKSNKKNSFQRGVLEFYSSKEIFDLIYSLDGLYSIKKKKSFFTKIKKMLSPNGMFLFFQTEVSGARGQIIDALKETGFKVEQKDFSFNEQRLWERVLKIGKEMEGDFKKEGNLSLLHTRMAEAKRSLYFYQQNLASRHLFIAR